MGHAITKAELIEILGYELGVGQTQQELAVCADAVLAKIKEKDPCYGKVAVQGDGEPIFVLRAQDLLATGLVMDWIEKAAPLAPRRRQDALDVYDAMRRWQFVHPERVKRPD